MSLIDPVINTPISFNQVTSAFTKGVSYWEIYQEQKYQYIPLNQRGHTVLP